MEKKIYTAILTLCLLGLTAFASTASAKNKIEPQPPAPAAPAMDEATMAKMKEYSTPNENHALLQSLAGIWEYTMKWWMSPDAPPEVSSGTNKIVSILGGRFIKQIISGTSMGQPFEGRGTMGYDNIKKKFVATWIDNMATGIMSSTSTYDPATKTFTEEGNTTCPLEESGTRSFKAMTKIIDENNFTYEMYLKDPGGKEFKAMEITYKRK